MQKKMISIVTPVYNAEKFIDETINSVLTQTYAHFEWLLVEDHSSDNSYDLINSYAKKDDRIVVLQTPENSGAAVARNMGLTHAKGDIIAFIDSDDKWYSEKLEKQWQFMLENQFGFTYTKFELINQDGTLKKTSSKLPDKLNYVGLLKNTAIACSTVMIDKRVTGDFRMPLVRKGQDTATWLKLLRKIDYAYLLDKTLNQYRTVENSLSSNKLQAVKRTWNTYYNLEEMSFLKAAYYLMFSLYNATMRRI